MSFYEFMPTLLNMSLTASVAIVLVTLLRLLLKKTPKVISYALWGVVLFRLLCPVSIGSDFSVYNLFDAPTEESGTVTSIIEYVPSDIVHTEYPSVALPVTGISDAINENLPQGEEQLRADPLEGPLFIATYVWLTGVLAMVIYSIVSYVRLRRRLSVVVLLRDNIFIADDIKSPFVVGLFRPKIYLPCNLGDKEQEYIILHEQHHIKRLDHVMKVLAFLALAIHWFNPLVWVAFILASKDMEMSCDESVIRKVDGDVRADYSASLLTLATGRRIIAGTPLAFGEGDTTGRIRNLANWRKPTFWVVLVAVIACIALAVGLMTNPAEDMSDPAEDGYYLKIGADGVESIEITGPNTSGGAVHADGSVFKNGEKVWLEPLQGVTDLRGYSITAIGKNGEIAYAFSIPEGATTDEVINLVGSDGWLLAPTDYVSNLSGIAGKTYVYEDEGILGSFTITLYDDGTFTYYEGMASSYIAFGSWKQDGDVITLTDDGHGGYALVNHFKLAGDDLVFVDQDSDNFVYVKVEDGEKFNCTGEALKQVHAADDEVTEQISERNAIAAGIVDLIPMVMVDGRLYLDTGLSSNADARCGVMDGEITSTVDGSQRPTENNQSNFGTGYGYQIGATEGTIEIYMNEEWWIFATEEVRNTLHFPTTERVFEFNFAGNTSGGQKMELTEIYPYWCIEIENTGNGTIQMELQGEVYRVEAGTTKTFCSDEKWEAGTYTVSFSTTGYQPMQGNAICTRSKAPMTDRQATPASTYNPKGVSGSNVKELSRISGEFESQGGVSFVDLAPSEEVVSSSEITLEENSSVMLFITWGAQDLFLEFGIRAEDGTEYFQEKQGGSSILLIEDIPAGTYRLYVKNSDAYNGIPAYENPDEFDGVSFDATGAMNYRVQ